jgi:tetratricopeptide (TPR) repeat protein
MIRLPAVAALCVFRAVAQFPGGPDHTILCGQVLTDQLMAESYIVELQPLSGSMNRQQTLASNNGEFQISGVELGDYRLTVTDHAGRTLYQQLLHVDKSGAPIEVRLPSNTNAKPPAGAVSYASLQHKVPRSAVHEYKAAVEARQHADPEAALAHLRKAVAIDPQFAAAHNDLAAQYLDGKLYDSALEELDKAVALDPASIPVKLNRAICLSRLGRYTEAETSARQAVQLDGGSSRSRYLLGLILANQKKFSSEAIDDLERSSDQFPEARVAAAQILARSGRNAEARQQLQLYLNGCKAENCREVRSWLDRLVE